MNNLDNLYPCLDSIKRNTTVSYETFVVAFLFSQENLDKLRIDYPWVRIVESNEYRGFSENNNLALRLATGKYCFVLNDDTYHEMPVIDELVSDFEQLPTNVAVISPVTLNRDGSVQRCGKPKYSMLTYFLGLLKLIDIYEKHSSYVNKQGLFKTYNLSGACFMIKRDVFEKFGWFDEKYYFCPEDIALSTLLNNNGYECWVDTDIQLTHYAGGTRSKMLTATGPTMAKGAQIFYTNGSKFKLFIFNFVSTFIYIFRALYWKMKVLFNINDEKCKNSYEATKQSIRALYSNETPKQLFIRRIQEIKKV